MKKILGLDLGSASIGWAMISEEQNEGTTKTNILGMGSRIIPYEGTEGRDFAAGTGESKNSIRTRARTTRKGYDRYQLRRKNLVNLLLKLNMMPGDDLKSMQKMQLWELRSKAANEAISLAEFGRILLLLNQKRGYKSSRSDANLDKKDTEYVAEVKNRFEKIKELNFTIGQYFFSELKRNEYFRIKDNIFPREAYLEEFDRICKTQQNYHKTLTDELIKTFRDEIIYFQRPLKSQKGLVSVCEFEGFWVEKNKKEYFVGPKVAPKSSPIFQAGKIWENINNIKVSNREGVEISLSIEQKKSLYYHLENNDKLSSADLLKILNLRRDNCFLNKQLEKGIKGNITRNAIRQCFGNSYDYDKLLRFDLKVVNGCGERFLYDKDTGEVKKSKPFLFIDPGVEKEPLYRLWHTIYSITDQEECKRALENRFGIEKSIAEKLASIDFRKYGFGNKSVKVIRMTLPYLIDGDSYSDAMCYGGYNHSRSFTNAQNLGRKLFDTLKPVPKNSLRQPVVEKILNQMVNLVNGIIMQYGRPDEIRIELARELKQSREERNERGKAMNKRERENEDIAKGLAEYGLRATRNNIIKWRLYEEIDEKDKKLNAMCIYCGQPISRTEAIKGTEVDVEHIIPKSKLFDDSQSNKTLAHRNCNRNKNDMTAFDFMKGKSDQEFTDYIDRVNLLYTNRVIGKAKRDKMLMTEGKIPTNFIDRQLRESQYISKKAREILESVCFKVWTTSGIVTSELRYLWGWEDVTMKLQLPRYKELGLTEYKEWESGHNNSKHKKEVIKGWTKRDDQRHHAVDALTIACTKQGFIQRFNSLNAAKTREEMMSEIKASFNNYGDKLSLLEKYIISQRPIPESEVEIHVSKILVSYKAGKKVAVIGNRKTGKRGNRKVVQTGIVVPRGALSEQNVYGKIKVQEEKKSLKYLFENPHLIFKIYIKELVEKRLSQFDGNVKKSIASLKDDPIYLNKEKTIKLEYATCFREEYVIRYNVDTNFNKVDKVIDNRVREFLQNRLNKFEGKHKEAFKDVQLENKTSIKWFEEEGLVRPINSVRCFTGLSAVVPVRKNEYGIPTGFVKPGNNHHIAIYTDSEGRNVEHVCTFWHAVERKKFRLPVIIANTNLLWDKILENPENTFPESFQERLPGPGLELNLSMQQNEMFVLGLSHDEIISAIEKNDLKVLSGRLYRVQKLGHSYYTFRHHLETQIVDDAIAEKSDRFIRVRSINSLFALLPFKIKIDSLGKIVS